MESVDNELEELRRRAYGRQGDIHLDARALERLRELEGEQAAHATDEVTEPIERFEPADDELSPITAESPLAEPEERDARSTLRRWFERLSTLRRSTIVITLSVLAFVATVAVTLTVVQRVQTDPLQTGASQIARLQPDPDYQIPDQIPDVFGTRGENVHAYQDIHGLRVLVTAIPIGKGTKSTSDCIGLYFEPDVSDPASTSLSEEFFGGGCAVAGFPAISEVDLLGRGLSPSLRKEFAPWTGLQFVYDKRDDEVVVFGSK